MRPSIETFDLDDLSAIAITEVLAVDFPCDGDLPLTSSLYDTEADEDDSTSRNKTRILIFGTTRKGHSVALDCRGWQPTLIFEFAGHYDALEGFLQKDAASRRRPPYKIRIKKLKRFYGYVPSKKNPLETELFDYFHVSVESLQDLSNLKKRLCSEFKDITFVNEGLKMSTAFCNEYGLVMSSWLKVDPTCIVGQRDRDTLGWSSCQIEIDIDLTKKPSLEAVDLTDVPPWIACSFDCEMMSYDGLFPMTTKGDHTVALCATLWNVKEGPQSCEKHAFVLTDKVKGPLNPKLCNVDFVHEAKTSQDLLKSFREFILDHDVDLLTGWNIYGFDMPFLWHDLKNYFVDHFLLRGTQSMCLQVAKACGTLIPSSEDLLQRLRMTNVKAAKSALSDIVKKQPTLSKNHADWPESIARSFRKTLFGLLGDPELQVPQVSKTTVQNWPESDLKRLVLQLAQDRLDQDLASGAQSWGRIRTENSKLELRNMTSAAKGDNTYSIWSATGRITVDLMQIIKDDKKPESNSLRFAAETWLDKDNLKKDLEASEMFEAQASGSVSQLETLLDQCIRDAEIPMLLIDKLSYMSTWIEMSRVTFTSLSQVLNGGQQRKVFNVIARFVHGEQAINIEDSGWPDCPDDDNADPLAKRKPDYQGATVIEPDPGHQETPVSVLDFESLQPSIIIFFNLCASNLLLGYSEDQLLKLKEACPGFEYETHRIEHNILEDPVLLTQRTEFRTYTFVKHSPGVLPRLLRHLLKSRKSVKALMAAETDAFKKNVLNGRQNGLKIVCNSVYGFCGVKPSKGLLSCKPVAAVTTLKGRAFIDAAKKFVEDHYKAHVLYGDTDSIMILWPSKNAKLEATHPTEYFSIPEAQALGEEASKRVTEILRNGLATDVTKPLLEDARNAVTLANEKVQCPQLLLKKKNYAGLKWTPSKKVTKVPGFGYELDMKGIDAVRRDRTKFVRELSEQVLEQLLIENNARQSISLLKTKVQDLVHNRVAIDDFVLSKSLKGTYASNNVPHVQAWLRMKERGDSGCPEKGGRMPIVMVEPYGSFANVHRKKVPLYQRCEHPEFVKKTPGIQLSRSQYLENLAETFDRLQKPTKYHSEIVTMFQEASEQIDHLDSKNSSLTRFFSGEALPMTEYEMPEVVPKSKRVKKSDQHKTDQSKISLSLLSFR